MQAVDAGRGIWRESMFILKSSDYDCDRWMLGFVQNNKMTMKTYRISIIWRSHAPSIEPVNYSMLRPGDQLPALIGCQREK
jgi:hypothetical protein